MSEKKHYRIVRVTKPGQGNKNTAIKHLEEQAFSSSHGPSGAARKAMTQLCKMKSIKGVCTLTVTMEQVKKRTLNGKKVLETVMDTSGENPVPVRWMYKLKREKTDGESINIGGKDIVFDFTTKVVESHGRV